MALVKETLALQLQKIFSEMRKDTGKPEEADIKFANKLASAIDSYIKTAQVAPGIPVATAGSPTAQTGATTGPGTLM